MKLLLCLPYSQYLACANYLDEISLPQPPIVQRSMTDLRFSVNEKKILIPLCGLKYLMCCTSDDIQTGSHQETCVATIYKQHHDRISHSVTRTTYPTF